MPATCLVSVDLVVVGGAEGGVVESGAGIGSSTDRTGTAEGRHVGGGEANEGGVGVAVGAEGVIDADVPWVCYSGAAGQKIAEGDAILEGVGVRGLEGIVPVDFHATKQFVLVSELIRVDGAVLVRAGSGAADLRRARRRGAADAGRRRLTDRTERTW